MYRRLAAIPVLAAAIVGLVACGGPSVGGTPSPGGGGSPAAGGGGASSSAGPSQTTGSAGDSPLASVQPCSLLSSAEQTQLGVNQTGSGDDSGARHCDYHKNVDENGLNGYAIGVDLRDAQGVAGANTSGYTVTAVQFGSHQAKQLTGMTAIRGNCIIIIGINNTSRVDIPVNAGTNTHLACQVADAVAKAIEPELPAGS